MSAQGPDTTFWDIVPLGRQTADARDQFAEDMASESGTKKENLFDLGGGPSHLYDNPRLEVGVLQGDAVVAAHECWDLVKGVPDAVNVYLERYFIQSMPGRDFDLQLSIATRHQFTDQGQSPVAHTMAVRGVIGDFVNYLSEPIFGQLSTGGHLTLDIAVTFVSDRGTRQALSVLDSEAVRKGVTLLGTYNPVFGAAAGYAKGLLKMCLENRRNQALTEMHLGFRSKRADVGLPLLTATYVFIQPSSRETHVSFSGMRYDRETNRLVVGDKPVERNYMFVRVD
jgi:hypothetical protein